MATMSSRIGTRLRIGWRIETRLRIRRPCRCITSPKTGSHRRGGSIHLPPRPLLRRPQPPQSKSTHLITQADRAHVDLHPQTYLADDPDLAWCPHAHVRRDPVRAGRTGRTSRARTTAWPARHELRHAHAHGRG